MWINHIRFKQHPIFVVFYYFCFIVHAIALVNIYKFILYNHIVNKLLQLYKM